MAGMNAQVNPQALQKTLHNFEMESAKMDMKEEMCKHMGSISVQNNNCVEQHLAISILILIFFVHISVNEGLDSVLDESGDEEEQDAIVNQVLDEIGIDIAGKVKNYPCSGHPVAFGSTGSP